MVVGIWAGYFSLEKGNFIQSRTETQQWKVSAGHMSVGTYGYQLPWGSLKETDSLLRDTTYTEDLCFDWQDYIWYALLTAQNIPHSHLILNICSPVILKRKIVTQEYLWDASISFYL